MMVGGKIRRGEWETDSQYRLKVESDLVPELKRSKDCELAVMMALTAVDRGTDRWISMVGRNPDIDKDLKITAI